MSAALGTLDGKNRNPIIANSQHKRKDFEYIRRIQEFDESIEDEIDSYESKLFLFLNF